MPQVTTLATIDPTDAPAVSPCTLGAASADSVVLAIDSCLSIFSVDCQEVTTLQLPAIVDTFAVSPCGRFLVAG